MKGINVRKIAALAGVGLLGLSAFAVADVVYGSTQLVDQNGQPTVKIYVGSKAAVSDGVAAANIAAKIANEAYKSSTLTASVVGTPTCSVGSGVSGTGTCSVVESSKKVTLEVQVPGVIAGTHTFKTLITDTIDKTLANRNASTTSDSDNIYPSNMTAQDTSGQYTSPLKSPNAYQDQDKGKLLYRIGSTQFSGFADYSVVDTQAVSTTYTEEQSFWVGSTAATTLGGASGVVYDTGAKDVVVNKFSAMAYDIKFVGNDYGIPVCTGDLNTTTDDWTSCSTSSNSRTSRHRVKLKFMGGEWIISSMTQPTAALSSSTALLNGGEVKLAKEAKYGIINVGQTLDAGTFKIRLSDISVAVGAENVHPAILDILDAGNEDAVIGQVQVDPDTTYTFTQSGTGKSVKIHVYKTAPGFTLNAKWAELAIYSDEITLKDGSRYNLVSSTDTDKNFKVSLFWKNKDYTGASGGASSVADCLREIVIYNTDGFTDKTLAGESESFLVSSPTFKVTYNGLDLTDDDYQQLTYTAQSPDTYRVSSTSGDSNCSSSSNDYSYTGVRMVEIRASGDQLLGGSGDALSGDYMLETVLFDPIGTTWNGTAGGDVGYYTDTYPNGRSSQSANVSAWLPKLFWKVSGRDCYNWVGINYTSSGTAALSNSIKFDTAGANSAAQGMIFFASNVSMTSVGAVATYGATILLQEDAGKYSTASNTKVFTAVPMIVSQNSTGTASYPTHRFRSTDSTTQQVYYMGFGNTSVSYTAYDLPFISERGSKTTTVSTTDASFKVAKKVAMPTFQFAYSDTSTTTGGEVYVLGVGESKVFGGVTVKVKAIDATCGSCSVLGAGGTPACTVDSSGVSAVIKEENSATVTATIPFQLKSDLVMMDSNGPSAGVAILVGGPIVNTMTADALRDSAVDFNTDSVVVKEIGNKIVVAGKTAADTLSAADQFIAGVKRQ